MIRRLLLILLALLALVTVFAAPAAAQQSATIGYDLLYVKAPRPVPDRPSKWGEVFRPFNAEPNSDLVILHPDGTEEVLVDAPPTGAVIDPFPSFDAQWVYYSLLPDVVRINDYPVVPVAGADIYKVHVATKQIVRLTHGERTPLHPDGFAGYSVFNTGPTPLAGGKIAFTSNRNGLMPPKGFTPVTMQLFTMNSDGSEVELIAPMTLGSTLHPFQLVDGRICFSSMESQGHRDARLWGYWCIWEDGTTWEPLDSAFAGPDVAKHFATQTTDGSVVIEGYYNLNNEGFGMLWKFPAKSPTGIGFQSPIPSQATSGIVSTEPGTSGRRGEGRTPFLPVGVTAVTPFTHATDRPAPQVNGDYYGKVTHPSGAPNNDLLLVWSDGPVNSNGLHLPLIDSGIYIARNAFANMPSDLVLVKNDPNFNEQWPRALVPYKAIYGVDQPRRLPVNQNDGTKHDALPAGTPYGIVGSASVFQRESAPGVAGPVNFDGQEPFYDCFGACSNWWWQGSDAGLYTNDDIASVRIVVMEGGTQRGPNKLRVPVANERLRIQGEVPVQADGSFAAKIPADTPFTFQLVDKRGQVTTTAQTWHQVRPGEVRTDCGGCHSHSMKPLAFATSTAAKLAPADLTLQPAHDVEFVKDIRPILQAKCASCHTAGGPAPRLDSTEMVQAAPGDGGALLPRDYGVLAADTGGAYGGPRAINRLIVPNLSRYVRVGQSRRSVLMWTLTGARTDGWTNDRWPTETVPGDATTLPAGADRRLADLDFRVDHSALVTDAERRAFAAWIDLFAPIDLGGGFFADQTRPALTVAAKDGQLLIGAADAYSGLDETSLRVTVNGTAVPLTATTGNRWTAPASGTAQVQASVRDRSGNTTTLTKTLTVSAPPPPVDCVVSSWSAWSTWTPATSTTEQRSRTRTVLTQPANGGAACPALSETETRATTLPAPSNLRFEGGATLSSAPARAGFPIRLFPRLQWDPVVGADYYEVKFTWSSGRTLIDWLPVMSLDWPLPMGQPGHQYRVSIRACKGVAPGAVASETVCWSGASAGARASMVVER